MEHLAIIATDGNSAPTRVKAAESLDRGVSSPSFSADGKFIRFLVTDDRSTYPAQVNVTGGNVERLLAPPSDVSSWDSAANRSVMLSGGVAKHNDIYAMGGGTLRQLP